MTTGTVLLLQPPAASPSSSIDPRLAMYSDTTKADSAGQMCKAGEAKTASPPATTEPGKPARPAPKCDLQQLKVDILDSVDADFAGDFEVKVAPGVWKKESSAFVASRRMRGDKLPANAPQRLHADLNRYDLVLEVLTESRNKEGGSRKDERDRLTYSKPSAKAKARSGLGEMAFERDEGPGPARVKARASWKATCGEAAHKTLALDWTDEDGDADHKQVGPDAPLTEFVQARPFLRDVFSDPLATWNALLHHDALTQRYELTSASCGRWPGDTGTNDLNALIIAHPADQWGILFEWKFPVISFGWSAERSDADKDAEAAALEKKAKAVKFPNKKLKKLKGAAAYDAHKAAAGAQRDKILLQKQAIDQPASKVAAAWQDVKGGRGMERGDKIAEWDFGVVMNDRLVFTKDDWEKFSFKAAKASIFDTINQIKNASQTISEVITAFQKYSPTLVQPQFGLEIELLSGEMGVSSRYKPAEKGDRFLSVSRQVLLEAELKLIGMTGILALVVGKDVAGFTFDITGSVTVGAAVFGETKLHFAPWTGFDEFWKKVVSDSKIKGELEVIGRIEGRAKALGYHIAQAGGAIRGKAEFEDWVIKGAFGCTIKCHTVTGTIYASSQVAGKGKSHTFEIMEASANQHIFWRG